MTAQDGVLYAQVQPIGLDIHALQAQMQEHIPQYAMPHQIPAVEAFPLTRAGKLDYAAVAKSNSVVKMVSQAATLVDASEAMVERALRGVLGISNDSTVNLDANIYDLGGTSISQLYFSHRLTKMSGHHVSISMIVKSPTLRHLASMLAVSNASSEDVKDSFVSEHEVSPIEKDWWNKYEHGGGSSSFNVTFACELHQGIDKSKLVAALNHVLARHRILRSRYHLSPCNDMMRKYANAAPVALEVPEIDLDSETHRLFNLRDDDLVRVLVSPTQIVIVISHIICDLTTLQILFREVASFYHGKQPAPLERKYSRLPLRFVSPYYLSFWEQHLSGAPIAQFPFGTNCPRRTWSGSSMLHTMPDPMYQRKKSFTERQNITMHQLALAAIALALQGDQKSCDIVLGAPYLNRHSKEYQNVVGLFLEPLPIQIRYPTAETQNMSFVRGVQQASRLALSHASP